MVTITRRRISRTHGIKTYRFATVARLLSVVSQHCKGNSWMYRGVSSLSTHFLIPSIGRHAPRRKRKKINNKEEQLLQKFEDQIRPHVTLQLKNKLEWMILGQHHGLPTRLLDWTASPLVAAYFASQEHPMSQNEGEIYDIEADELDDYVYDDGAIYAVKKPELVDRDLLDSPFSIDGVVLVEPPIITERIGRQSGLLTLHSKPYIRWEPDKDSVLIFKVDDFSKYSVRKSLDEIGINEASLFSGIDATARHLGWKFKSSLVAES